MDITIGICSRNRCDILEKTLLSLCDQTIGPDRFEVALVDDGSTDNTRAMVEKLNVPYQLNYIYQDHAGLATARNTGILNSSGDLILYIDDDVLAHPELLLEHYKTHQTADRIVCNGWVNHVTEAVRPENPEFTMADISTSFFWTSNVSVKRKHLLEAGCFDEDFTEYGWEDQEVGLRLMAIGLTKKNNYNAIGFHVKKIPTYANIAGAINQAHAKARSALIYIQKHPRLRTRLATGAHPPRLAWAMFTNIGGYLERYLEHQLELKTDEDPATVNLSKHQQWCLKNLSTVHYFKSLMLGKTHV